MDWVWPCLDSTQETVINWVTCPLCSDVQGRACWLLVRETLCQQEQTVEAEGEARMPHSLHWPCPALHGQLFKSPQAGHKSQPEYSPLLISAGSGPQPILPGERTQCRATSSPQWQSWKSTVRASVPSTSRLYP